MAWPVLAQEAAPPAAEKPAEKTVQKPSESKDANSEKVELPFQIQLLETHLRFETNGDSRKEVHTIVKINNILGAREFSRLTFDYNRGWQQVQIPLVRVSHANGGTSELLPSAVTDAPNPAVEKFPAYQDVRVKSARILGLQEGDTIEYRVITTSTKPPLAPEFWLEHTFDRSGQVLEEDYVLELPAGDEPKINADTPADSTEKTGEGLAAMKRYAWHRKFVATQTNPHAASPTAPDVALNTVHDWATFSAQMANTLYPEVESKPAIKEKAAALTASAPEPEGKLESLYDFVARNMNTVDLPIGSTGYRTRPVEETLASGYATQEDKAALLAALARAIHFLPFLYLTYENENTTMDSMPSRFRHVFLSVPLGPHSIWMDPGIEVAPFGMLPSSIRGSTVFCVTAIRPESRVIVEFLPKVPEELPFLSKQDVSVSASLSREGALTSTVKYVMRGDNELLLREAFHGTAKEKWKDVANLLAISDGFRGEITSVNVSDPMATREPFKVEYTITRAKFVDWSKKPVRIPALLPQIGLPDLPKKAADGDAAPKIELGTPLDVKTQMTLKLPAGTKAVVPPGTAVNRDYARFSSKYGTSTGAGGETVTASRSVNFLMREIDGTRGLDYNAFVRAVQNDQAGMIMLDREAEKAAAKK